MTCNSVLSIVVCSVVLLPQASTFADVGGEQPSVDDELRTETHTRTYTAEAIDQICRDDVQGFRDFRPYWIGSLPEEKWTAFREKTRNSVAAYRKRYGEFLGVEHVRVDRVGESLQRRYFLGKFERGAMVWVVTYYRPHNEWRVTNFSFNQDLSILFRQ